MARRNSILEELLEQFFELTGYFWQVGLVISALFIYFAYKSYNWVSSIEQTTQSKPVMAVFEQFSFFLYLLPVSMLFISVVFALKTYSTYRKQKGI